jgi:hypothetical protein
MRPLALAAALALGVVLAAPGCLHVEVTTQGEPGADFSALRSFAVAPPEEEGDAAVAARVQREITRVLEDKGYAAAPLEGADMVVAFRAGGETRSRYQYASDPDTSSYVARDYIEGTLAIDVFGAAGREPVWHGTGQVDVFRERDVEDAAAQSVRAILAGFPPRP